MCWRPLIDKVRDAGAAREAVSRRARPVFRRRWPATLPDAVFTGYLTGEPLATAYASADIFVFPSTTDTFGNVIIEAQASGLPVIVSDLGGPKELVEDVVNGIVTKAHDDRRGGKRDHSPRERRGKCGAQMGRKARQSVLDRSWPDAFRKFWNTTEL